MQYIALYTAPALLRSKTLFNENYYYFFGNIAGSSFQIDELKKAQYLGIWEEINKEKPSYLHIEFLGKIVRIRQFTLKNIHTIGNEAEITNLQPVFENWNNIEQWESNKIQEAFRIQVSNFHVSKESGDIHANIPASWYSIEVEQPIQINEDRIAYQSKKLISFALNLDKNKKYIPSNNLIKTIRVSDSAYYHIEKNILIVDGWEIMLWGSNENIYGAIIELLSISYDTLPSVEDVYRVVEEKLEKRREGNIFNNAPTSKGQDIDHISQKKMDIDTYGNLEKNFNKTNFCKYLDFSISISARGIISKKQK